MNASPPLVVTAADPSAQDPEIVGGKAASLAALQGSGANVPAFFVVTTEAFKLHLGNGAEPLTEMLADHLAKIDTSDSPVSVRSSAVGEDGAEHSFAGLYRTVLGAVGIDEVTAAVEACWASYNAPEALDYRTRRQVPDGAMAVVVQRLVDAEWAGVSFDANPVELNLDEILINAAPGIGEALVSGEVNPEEIVVDRSTGRVLRHHRPPDNAPVPTNWIGPIAEETARISYEFGFPQDVEWALLNDELFVLQSRPITNVADVFVNRSIEPWRNDPSARPADPERIWSRAYADDIWAPPVSPLFYCVQNLTPSFTSYWNWHGDETRLPPDVFKYHDACAYVDIDTLRRQYAHHPRLARIQGVLSFFPPELRDSVAKDRFEWKGRLRRTLRFELRQRRLRSLAHNHRTLASMWPSFVETTDRWFDHDVDDLTDDELRAHQEDIGSVVSVVSPACGFAVAYHAHDLTFVLTGLLDRWFGDGDRLYALVSGGLDASVTVAEAASLWRLGRLVQRCAPDLVDSSPTPSWHEARPALLGHEAGREFVREFEAFWRSHRHRGASYKDLVFERWGDDIDRLLRAVLAYASHDIPDPAASNAAGGAKRRSEQKRLLEACRGRNAWRRPILRWLFRYNEIYMSERDNHRFYFDRVWYQLRRVYQSYGRRLATNGVLADPDDVFFLGTNEIDEAVEGSLKSETLRMRVEIRRRTWNRTREHLPSRYLRGYAPHLGETTIEGSGALRGIGASPGEVVGRAHVVRSVDELDQIAPGEILITQQTDPAWSVAFPLIAGLVLETGGVLAHGASLCREYSLPCVTAVEGAMTLLSDGALVRVDGATGVVALIDEHPTNDATTTARVSTATKRSAARNGMHIK